MQDLLAHAGLAHALVLLGGYAAVVLWEQRSRRPAAVEAAPQRGRWLANFGLLACAQALPWVSVPMVAGLSAWGAQTLGIGLLARLELPLALAVVLALPLLDLVDWLQHALMHRVDVLWRIHRVHHSDMVFDASLGFRFHPLETLLRAAGQALAVVALGLPPEAVLLAGLLALAHNAFSHAACDLPPGAEARLGAIVITPALHRQHHASAPAHSTVNLGAVFSVWDRLFGSLRRGGGQAPLQIGLRGLRDPDRLGLAQLLAMPWSRCEPDRPAVQDCRP